MQNFFTFFKCGSYNLKSNKLTGDYIVRKLSDLNNIIIPIFDKYPILGIKSLYYHDFKKVFLLIKNKAHFTCEGLD